jgi:peptidoglycan/LPS O-acetylase OafA/YrhL
MQNEKKYVSVQALRGLAALSVMFFHFRYLINEQYPSVGDYLFGWGAMGVDLFFVISGFVITLSALKLGTGKNAAQSFLKSRFKRIVPTYFILLLFTFILSGGMSIFHYHEKIENLLSAVTFSPLYDNNAPFYINDSGTFGVRWTLNYEIYFYLVAGICLLFKKPYLLLLAFFSTVLVILPILSGREVTFSSLGYQYGNPYLNMLSNPISWLFISGVIIALAVPFMQKIPRTARIVYLLLATGFMINDLFITKKLGHGLSASGLPLMLFLSGVVMNDEWLKKITPRWLIFLGDISFSLYLIHTLMNTGIGTRLIWTGLTENISGFILYSICSLLLATLSYKYIEKIFLRKTKKANLRELA